LKRKKLIKETSCGVYGVPSVTKDSQGVKKEKEKKIGRTVITKSKRDMTSQNQKMLTAKKRFIFIKTVLF